MARYFDAMQAIVERHGGIVEKYIGDAVMAVFGVPVAARGRCPARGSGGVEMRETLAALNDELERGWGVRLAARIGVNTGEVIAGDHSQGHLFVTGEAVNVAKRLEEAAETSEILIGEATHQLVRDAVLVERGASRTVKHGEAVDALRCSRCSRTRPGARAGSTRLRRARAPARGAASVFEKRGQRPGLPSADGARRRGHWASRGWCRSSSKGLGDEVTVLRGRCLPYGEGITYWPLAEVVKDVARARARIRASSPRRSPRNSSGRRRRS